MGLRLNRNIGQKIIINKNIIVTLEGINPNHDQASIQIDAPRGVTIDREEIFLQKQKEINK